MSARPLLLATLPWLLVSHAAWQQCTADAWGKLKAEADKDVPPPTDQVLRMVTTFVCEPAPETPEAR